MPATAQVRIAADTAQFQRAMDKVNKTMFKMQRQSTILGSVMRNTFGIIPKVAGFTAFAGIPGVLAGATRAFTKFEKDVAEVYTLLPKANRAFFREMQKDALGMSERFGVMPEEVTKGMYQAISAGISPDTLTDEGGFLDIAQKSAVAGVTDLKTAVDALTNVQNSYGKGVYDTAQVSDLLFKAVSMSKTTFRELSDYLYQVLPTAGSLKLRLDDLLGSISALAAQGTLTRVATTQIRQMLIEIGRVGDKANAAFLQGTGGISLQRFLAEGGRMNQIVAIMSRVARQRGTDIRNLFGSVEAGNAAIALATSRQFEGMLDQLDEKTGAASGSMMNAFVKIADTISFKFGRIVRVVMNTFIRLGDVIKPAIDDIIIQLEKLKDGIMGIPWDQMAANFRKSWHVIKKAIKDGTIWKILQLYLKQAFIGIQILVIKTSQIIGDSLANIFSFDNADFMAFLGAFKDSFLSIINRIVVEFQRLGPAVLDALIPALAMAENMAKNFIKNIVDDPLETPLSAKQKRDEAAREYYAQTEKPIGEAGKLYQTVEKEFFDLKNNMPDLSIGAEGVDPFTDSDPNLGFKQVLDRLIESGNKVYELTDLPRNEGQGAYGLNYIKAVEGLIRQDLYTEEDGKLTLNTDKIVDALKEYRSRVPNAERSPYFDDAYKNVMNLLDVAEGRFISAYVAKKGKETGQDLTGTGQIKFATSYAQLVKEMHSTTSGFSDAIEESINNLEDIADNEIKESFIKLVDTSKKLAKSMAVLEIGGSETESPEIKKLQKRIQDVDDALKSLIKSTLKGYKPEDMGDPQSGAEDLTGDPIDEGGLPRIKYGKVVADSLQKMGGGGRSAFLRYSDPTAAQDRNTSAVQENTKAIKSATPPSGWSITGNAGDFDRIKAKSFRIYDYLNDLEVSKGRALSREERILGIKEESARIELENQQKWSNLLEQSREYGAPITELN